MIINGDCKEELKKYSDSYFHSCVTDPPYGIKFMNQKWDYSIPSVEIWKEIYRVLRPGGFVLCFCGTRTQHRMAVNIEDAGFHIRDVIAWIYGQGFPKSLDIGKAIDKQLGVYDKREIIGYMNAPGDTCFMQFDGKNTRPFLEKQKAENNGKPDMVKVTLPYSEEAKTWDGWGTSLKPAMELITVAQKPIEGTFANNIMKYDVGGLNIHGCLIELQSGESIPINKLEKWSGFGQIEQPYYEQVLNNEGRFPANVILDKEAGAVLDIQSGSDTGAKAPVKAGNDGKSKGIYSDYKSKGDDGKSFYGDIGGASRFFYCPKASRSERESGLENFDVLPAGSMNGRKDGSFGLKPIRRKNDHTTVKPIELMRYLCRLVTPIGGIILDPYFGTGSTGCGAVMEMMDFVGIELETHNYEIAEARIKYWKRQSEYERSQMRLF